MSRSKFVSKDAFLYQTERKKMSVYYITYVFKSEIILKKDFKTCFKLNQHNVDVLCICRVTLFVLLQLIGSDSFLNCVINKLYFYNCLEQCIKTFAKPCWRKSTRSSQCWHVYCIQPRCSLSWTWPPCSHFKLHAGYMVAQHSFPPTRTSMTWQVVTQPPYVLRPAQIHDTYKSNTITITTPSTLPSFLSSHTWPFSDGLFLLRLPFSITFSLDRSLIFLFFFLF